MLRAPSNNPGDHSRHGAAGEIGRERDRIVLGGEYVEDLQGWCLPVYLLRVAAPWVAGEQP